MRIRLVLLILGLLLFTTPAWCYVDPGTFGLVSQWGYLLLVAVGGVFMVGFRRIVSLLPWARKKAKCEAAETTDEGTQ